MSPMLWSGSPWRSYWWGCHWGPQTGSGAVDQHTWSRGGWGLHGRIKVRWPSPDVKSQFHGGGGDQNQWHRFLLDHWRDPPPSSHQLAYKAKMCLLPRMLTGSPAIPFKSVSATLMRIDSSAIALGKGSHPQRFFRSGPVD